MALLVVGIWVFLLVMRLGWLLVVMLSLRLSRLCFRSLLFSVLVVLRLGLFALQWFCCGPEGVALGLPAMCCF